ncbi:MAG: NADH-quinone oxidoreductase subunit C [Elusimicrobiota bacterium]
MEYNDILKELKDKHNVLPENIITLHGEEVYIETPDNTFASACRFLHKKLKSPVMMMYATDERKDRSRYVLYCVFISVEHKKWYFLKTPIPGDNPAFQSIAKDIFSANLFEREIKEMFGIKPEGNPDMRTLRLHEEVWPPNNFPLRKDFSAASAIKTSAVTKQGYKFNKIDGEGIFEIPVGPVHAGIIGPGHFRFSVAGEPVINLEIRLGFTHRGIEKLLEGNHPLDGITLAECVSGDTAFAHSLAYCNALEKVYGLKITEHAMVLRSIYLELERMYNHVSDIGGIALDAGFTFPSAYSSILKETLLCLNDKITGSRYLKGINTIGGVTKNIDEPARKLLKTTLDTVMPDFIELTEILYSSASFMDRIETTGILTKNVAEDLGVIGLAARASGIPLDLRTNFPGIYDKTNLKIITQPSGDCAARFNMRVQEFMESARVIKELIQILPSGELCREEIIPRTNAGCGLGYTESWRGPVLYWINTDADGKIARCKIVDASFRNWQGLAFALPGNIVPDFPLCNKSFNLSYSGNDL